MTWSTKPSSRIERLSDTQKSIWTGDLKGRIKQARPVNRTAVESSPIEQDDEDPFESVVKFMQESFVVSRAGIQVLRLSYIPIDNSEHLYWGISYQRQKNFTRADGSGTVVVPDASGYLNIGDVLTVEYAYVDGNTAPEPEALRPAATFGLDYTIPSVSLPAATKPGSLIVMAASSTTPISFPDSRFTRVATVSAGSTERSVWVGYADDALSPVSMALTANLSGAVGFMVGAVYDPGSYVGEAVTQYVVGDPFNITMATTVGMQVLGFALVSYDIVPGPMRDDTTSQWDTVIYGGYGWAVGIFQWDSPSGTYGVCPAGSMGYLGALGTVYSVSMPLYGT